MGWKVRVQFQPLLQPPKPKDHIEVLRHLLPAHHSPLPSTGDGYQRYLTQLASAFVEVLAGLIGIEAQFLIGSVALDVPMQTNDDLDWWEHRIETGSKAIPPFRPPTVRRSSGRGAAKESLSSA